MADRRRLVDYLLVLSRGQVFKYPREDHADTPLPESVQLFCQPYEAVGGTTVSTIGAKHGPDYYGFVLTTGTGSHSFGVCLSFQEDGFTSGQQADRQCIICVLSHWPYFSLFQSFLEEMFDLYIAHDPALQALPLERYIAAFVSEAPVPHPNSRVEYPLLRTSLNCIRPPGDCLPYSDPMCMASMFSCLSMNNVLMLVGFLLTEQRILLHSTQLWRLTAVAEALLSLIFPFCWQHIYIPLLPYQLLEYVQAPVPFLMGVDSHFLSHRDVVVALPACAVVDLDNNKLISPIEDTCVGNHTGTLPEIPADLRSKVTNLLANVVPSPTPAAASAGRNVHHRPQVTLDVHNAMFGGSRKTRPRSDSVSSDGSTSSLTHWEEGEDTEALGAGVTPSIRRAMSSPKSLHASSQQPWAWVTDVRHVFLELFLELLEQWDPQCDPSQFHVSMFLDKCPALHRPFLDSFVETQVFQKLQENLQAQQPDEESRVFCRALRMWRCARGIVQDSRSAGGRRGKPPQPRDAGTSAASAAAATSARLRASSEGSLRDEEVFSNPAQASLGLRQLIEGDSEMQVFRALMPALFGPMPAVSRPSPITYPTTLELRPLERAARARMPSIHEQLFPDPSPMVTRAGEAAQADEMKQAEQRARRRSLSGVVTAMLAAGRLDTRGGTPGGSSSGPPSVRRERSISDFNAASLASMGPMTPSQGPRRNPSITSTASGSESGSAIVPAPAPSQTASPGGGSSGSEPRKERRHSFGNGVDRVLIESARRRAAMQDAALADAKAELQQVREQLNETIKSNTVLLAELNGAHAQVNAAQESARLKDMELGRLREETIPDLQAMVSEVTERCNSFRDRLQVAVADIRHLRSMLTETEDQLSRSQQFSVQLLTELDQYRRRPADSRTKRFGSPPSPSPITMKAPSPRVSAPTATESAIASGVVQTESASSLTARVALLQEQLEQERGHRERLWRVLQALKKDMRTVKHPTKASTGLQKLDTRTIEAEVAAVSEMLKRGAQHAQQRQAMLELQVGGEVETKRKDDSGEISSALRAANGVSSNGAAPGSLKEDVTFATSLSALYMEADAQATSLTLVLEKLHAMQQLVSKRLAMRGVPIADQPLPNDEDLERPEFDMNDMVSPHSHVHPIRVPVSADGGGGYGSRWHSRLAESPVGSPNAMQSPRVAVPRSTRNGNVTPVGTTGAGLPRSSQSGRGSSPRVGPTIATPIVTSTARGAASSAPMESGAVLSPDLQALISRLKA